MSIRLECLCCFVVTLAGIASSALACRYSVRDVGFVDLGAAPYCLFVCVPESQEEVVDELMSAMRASLLGSNIAGEVLLYQGLRHGMPPVRLPKDNQEPIREPTMLTAIHNLISQLEEEPGGMALPIGILVAPDGRLREIVVPKEKRESPTSVSEGGLPQPPQPVRSLKSNIQTIARIAATSPLREQISADLLEAHSVVLLVEGNDSEQNQAAKELAEQAIDRIKAGLGNLPKVIANAPKLVVVPAQDIAKEAVLLWGLGMSTKDADAASLVVLFGRMRKMGDVLTVPGAMEPELAMPLYFVGQDCECRLDRSVMQGPMVPHIWDDRLEAAAVKHLGFDPGHAMAKFEMSRILSHGPGFNSLGQGPGWYQEIIIEPLVENEEETSEPTAQDRPGLPGTSTMTGSRREQADSAPDLPEPIFFHYVWWLFGGIAVVVILLSGFLLFRTHGRA